MNADPIDVLNNKVGNNIQGGANVDTIAGQKVKTDGIDALDKVSNQIK